MIESYWWTTGNVTELLFERNELIPEIKSLLIQVESYFFAVNDTNLPNHKRLVS
jgi:hypothetical protein